MSDYDINNPFAKIIRGELPADKVYEDDNIIAFYDIAPVAPIHVVVISKKHAKNYLEFIETSSSEEISHFFSKINHIVDILGLTKNGFRLVSNTGKEGGQSVPHFHMHIIGGKKMSEILV